VTFLLSCKDADYNKEWLLTNGLGGYAMSTVSTMNQRRYHAWLVAATSPPVGRVVILSKVDEKVTLNGRCFPLGVNRYPDVVYPEGHRYLSSFACGKSITFDYKLGAHLFTRKILIPQGHNAVCVSYVCHTTEAVLTLRPYLTWREHHHLRRKAGSAEFRAKGADREVAFFAGPGTIPVTIQVTSGQFIPSECWIENVVYEKEASRGLDFMEDLYSPGEFMVHLHPGEECWLFCWAGEPPGAVEPPEEPQGGHIETFVRDFSRAAEQFLVRRGNSYSIIAGYPWFSDWGRDTFISLPGICLATGRFEAARRILGVFADHIKDGLLPNCFSENGPACYNSADSALWWIYALFKYLEYTGDDDFTECLYDWVRRIIEGYVSGSEHIRLSREGFIETSPGTQLTWMDAKVGDEVITPRAGMPVEISALWYNALRVGEVLAGRYGKTPPDAPRSAHLKERFLPLFWNEQRGCLFDVSGSCRDDAVRPNQLFAASLPFPIVDEDVAGRMLQVVFSQLWVPTGLRTLAPDHPSYRPRYEGGPLERDRAYHQGTVWAWLLGPLVDAVCYAWHHRDTQEAARALLRPLHAGMTEACIGQVGECFHAEPPHDSVGAPAQAWSVAEPLRAFSEHVLKVKRLEVRQ